MKFDDMNHEYFRILLLTIAAICLQSENAVAASTAAGEIRDVTYVASEDACRLARCKPDLKIPNETTGFPTVVWFHGGGLTDGRGVQRVGLEWWGVSGGVAAGGSHAFPRPARGYHRIYKNAGVMPQRLCVVVSCDA